MKEFLEVKLCPNCEWSGKSGLCFHPQLLDVATGEPTECVANRAWKVPSDQLTLPHCGPEGLFYRSRPVPALQAPSQ
jgi:hypothetical protein